MLARATRQWPFLTRSFASEAESHIEGKLKAALEKLREVKVVDTSGGCGTMFNLEIIAEEFRCVVASPLQL